MIRRCRKFQSTPPARGATRESSEFYPVW
jgi:hypothetical protein